MTQLPVPPSIGTLLKLAGPLEAGPLELLEGIDWHWQEGGPAGAFYVEGQQVE